MQIETVDVGPVFENYILRRLRHDGVLLDRDAVPDQLVAVDLREPAGRRSIQQNFARVGSQEIDELFDEASAELDPEEARELANEIDALIWEEVHSLTLYQRPDIIAAVDNLANYGALRLRHGGLRGHRFHRVILG